MPLYVADYLRDTMHLTTELHGAYMLLLMACWTRGGSLPADDMQLAGVVRMPPAAWRKAKPVLSGFFQVDQDAWSHKRVTAELRKAHSLSEKRNKAGSAGSESRWGKSDGKTRSERLSAARSLGTHTTEDWSALREVLENRCVKCGVSANDLVGGDLCKDHIRPIYMGGSDALENLQPLCRECNAGKGDDCHDHRNDAIPDWRERLSKRLANARQVPGPALVAKPSSSLRSEDTTTSSEASASAQPVIRSDRTAGHEGDDVDPDAQSWALAVSLLTKRGGLSDRNARTFFAGLLKRHRLTASRMLPALASAEDSGSPDLQPYLTQAAQNVQLPRQPSSFRAQDYERDQDNLARAFRAAPPPPHDGRRDLRDDDDHRLAGPG